ncbi:MAG: TIR domain-containing protein [Hyphomonadaceae bacterium]|nr:TIR domain-containing protein [Hyphomonadaceae bacterium]
MADVFISYRTEDTAWIAGRIAERLQLALDDRSVFLDKSTIEPGADFIDAIGDHIDDSRVLLAIIGSKWTDILKSKQHEPVDYVRIEIEQALARGIRVIPITIDGTVMPSFTDLPTSLEGLTRLHAFKISPDFFDAGMTTLSEFLKNYLARDLPSQPVAPFSADTSETDTNIKLSHRTEYWKTGKDGRPRYRIFVWIEASSRDLDRISKVTYFLHRTFKNPVREITDRHSKFELRTNGWGAFEIQANVEFSHSQQLLKTSRMITFD